MGMIWENNSMMQAYNAEFSKSDSFILYSGMSNPEILWTTIATTKPPTVSKSKIARYLIVAFKMVCYKCWTKVHIILELVMFNPCFSLSFADLWRQCNFAPRNQQGNDYGSNFSIRIAGLDVLIADSRPRYIARRWQRGGSVHRHPGLHLDQIGRNSGVAKLHSATLQFR